MCKTFIVAGTTTVRVFSFFIQEVPATHGNFSLLSDRKENQYGRREKKTGSRRGDCRRKPCAHEFKTGRNRAVERRQLGNLGYAWGRDVYHLRSLRRELMDLEIPGDFKIDIGEFLNFADYFFDGLIIDWMVQTKIREASDNVKEAIRRVERLRTRLYEMLEADA